MRIQRNIKNQHERGMTDEIKILSDHVKVLKDNEDKSYTLMRAVKSSAQRRAVVQKQERTVGWRTAEVQLRCTGTCNCTLGSSPSPKLQKIHQPYRCELRLSSGSSTPLHKVHRTAVTNKSEGTSKRITSGLRMVSRSFIRITK